MELLESNNLPPIHPSAIHTVREIAQQPRLWKETLELISGYSSKIMHFFNEVERKHDQFRIILTGAGTSAFVGETILPYLKKISNNKVKSLECIPTTNIVSNPYNYLDSSFPTIMISFARSGNSPESLAAVNLGEQIIEDFYGIILTCNEDGFLAMKKKHDKNHLVICMPKEANDKGFAMTSSFTTMLLSAFLLFHNMDLDTLKKDIEKMAEAGGKMIRDHDAAIRQLAETSFSKIVYLGSGVFEGLARESSLKLLELTRGKIPPTYDTSLGFRHGPKSILDSGTIVILFLSSHSYTRQYDLDILREISRETDRGQIIVLSSFADEEAKRHCDYFINFKLDDIKEDILLAFPYILFGQLLAMHKSLQLGFSPDNPSPTGVVNRVVKGVTIHSYPTNEPKAGGDWL
ncbi:MAG: SIS domain-containing protein [Bacillota bacterium]